MTGREYWRGRALLLEEAKHEMAAGKLKGIKRQFDRAEKKINQQIYAWYGRFAKNNRITYAEAKEWLKKGELEELKWDIEEYIKHGRKAALEPRYIKQLENASAKYHITRLESLKIRNRDIVEHLYSQVENDARTLMGEIFKDQSHRTAYELQMGAPFDVAAVDADELRAVLSKPWTADGTTFSENIWKSRDRLVNELHAQLSQNALLGKPPDEAISAISRKFGASKNAAARLVMTESAYLANAGRAREYKAMGVMEYEIVATLDSVTCAACGGMDGRRLPRPDFEPGATAPPFHPWCRCDTAPWYDGGEGERFARDEKGKGIYVSEKMKYSEWKKLYLKSPATA